MTLEFDVVARAPAAGPAAGPAQSRHDARVEARAELATAGVSPREPAIAARGYGPGHLVVALAGTFDRAAVERLRATLRDLDQVAAVELVVDLSALASCNSALARSLAELRIQRLSDGTRVELHSPPTELTTAMRYLPTQTHTVDDYDRRPGRVHVRDRSAPHQGHG